MIKRDSQISAATYRIQYFQVHAAQAAESKITQSHMGKQFNWAYRQAFYTSPSAARICLFDAKFDAESGYQTFKKRDHASHLPSCYPNSMHKWINCSWSWAANHNPIGDGK